MANVKEIKSHIKSVTDTKNNKCDVFNRVNENAQG